MPDQALLSSLDEGGLLECLAAFKRGNFSVRLPLGWTGVGGKIADNVNDILELCEQFGIMLQKGSQTVGKEGRFDQRVSLANGLNAWSGWADSVNQLIEGLVSPTTEMARVIGAVARGDLSQRMSLEIDGRQLEGQFLRSAKTLNAMVDQLNGFAMEVTRVAREVGVDGTLGGQAQVKGVAGTWKDLTDNVNLMAGNLTSQVRNIAEVTTAFANGDLSKKVTVDAKGEIGELADTINGMIDTLATFADQVTGVAREVGIEGTLGGQANVPGAAGTWKDLTGNVNLLAANLTNQVRAIAGVATAVTKGDLTRSIQVEASGEVAALKDNINEMIRKLRETTRQNAEQDWLKTNLAKFTGLLQGQRDLQTVCKLILAELAPLVRVHHGVVYLMDETDQGEPRLRLRATYAYKERKHLSTEFSLGEGLVGECALEKERILITNVPGDYVQIVSGVGQATPLNIVVLPILFETKVRAVIELASFERFSETDLAFLDQLMENFGVVLNTIEANARTEGLLKQSQSLTQKLQSQQEELRKTNDDLEDKANLLSDRNELKRKNEEVEMARGELELKAAQLAVTSKYKSEFLANMSHELRTPLNSLLILAAQLAANSDGNLSAKQVEFAKTIHASGNDLLNLISDILDLSKIESGTVALEINDVRFNDLVGFVERTFRHIADGKNLGFETTLGDSLPAILATDEMRLQQILKNLLSNAFKFTEKGSVDLQITPVTGGWSRGHESLDRASTVIAFAVGDTGIGIPPDKQQLIFEAFQQADGTTSRRFGGTGLGLSISRELGRLLGGEIRLHSVVGRGSTFTLYLPLEHTAIPASRRQFASSGMPGSGGSSTARTTQAQVPLAEQRNIAAPRRDPNGPLARSRRDELVIPEDDRRTLRPEDLVALIVEDDLDFSSILVELARKNGFKVLAATHGGQALRMLQDHKIDAITLDIHLPDTNGWALLDRLKHDPQTRHIPVQIISIESDTIKGRQLGALGVVAKPANREKLDAAFANARKLVEQPARSILVAAKEADERRRLIELVGGPDVEAVALDSGAGVLAALEDRSFDCAVFGLSFADSSVLDLLDHLRTSPKGANIPIVIDADRDLTAKETKKFQRQARSLPIKLARSAGRLLEEVTVFLHRNETQLGPAQRQLLVDSRSVDVVLTARKVLLVDDDVRNIFALGSLLENSRMEVLSAESGADAIAILTRTPGIDMVLMDIMMPEMDGYDTMRAIRKMPGFEQLPIIAITARAMQGDRERCIEAGASDYASKPIDNSQLLSLMRIWLPR